MSDDQPARELNPNVEQRDDGLFYSKRTGRRVGGASIYKQTEEEKARWQGAAQAARERFQVERAARVARGDPVHGKKPSRKAARAQALEDLKPIAIKAMEEILKDRKGVECPECGHILEKLKAPLAQVIATAVKVIEYADGKPIQKIEQDTIHRIEYVLGSYEPPSKLSLVSEPVALLPAADEGE